ncbi:hypothetical protein Nmel_013804 [Mimus melanotis]
MTWAVQSFNMCSCLSSSCDFFPIPRSLEKVTFGCLFEGCDFCSFCFVLSGRAKGCSYQLVNFYPKQLKELPWIWGTLDKSAGKNNLFPDPSHQKCTNEQK